MTAALPVHSKLGASSYDRWGKSLGGCPGSVRLSEGAQKTTSTFAERGTEAHSLAYARLSGQAFALLGEDEEDAAVDLYVEFIQELKAPKLMLEQRFDLTKYYPNLYGTADACAYWPDEKRLIVVDYKHGAGVPVEVENNSQLMYYGLGAMTALGLPVRSVELIIVQPRCFHADGAIRRWKTTPGRLIDFVADLIDDAIATEDPNAALVPGDHCRWCPAKASCPALMEKAMVTATQDFSSLTSYDPTKLAETLTLLPVMETWIKGVREFAYREAEQGRVPPGWKLVDKRATRKWRDDVNTDSLARNLALKPPEIMEHKLKSPAQVEKMLGKEAKQIFNQFVTSESSGKTLVQNSDKRAPAKERAVEEFEAIPENKDGVQLWG